MSAPPFYSPVSLRADLKALSHPNPEDPSLLAPRGEPRLALLRWLAHCIDPAASVASPDQLALFWHSMGLPSLPPDASGLRFPLSVAPNRARDRAAAAAFLRDCIDLALAFARRGETPTVGGEDGGGEADVAFSREDLDMFDLTASLVSDRHELFPGTTRLLHAAPRRKPLGRRLDSAANRASKPCVGGKQHANASKQPAKRSPPLPSREKILERLRTLQRDTAELRQALEESPGDEGVDGAEESALESLPDGGVVAELSRDAHELARLFDDFVALTADRFAERDAAEELAVPDAAQKRRLDKLMPSGRRLLDGLCDMLEGLQQVGEVEAELQQAGGPLAKLPQSGPVLEVEELRRRTEQQL